MTNACSAVTCRPCSHTGSVWTFTHPCQRSGQRILSASAPTAAESMPACLVGPRLALLVRVCGDRGSYVGRPGWTGRERRRTARQRDTRGSSLQPTQIECACRAPPPSRLALCTVPPSASLLRAQCTLSHTCSIARAHTPHLAAASMRYRLLGSNLHAR